MKTGLQDHGTTRPRDHGPRDCGPRTTDHGPRTTLRWLVTRRSSLPLAAAFTLLELLTVIAIMGILAAIALPNLKSLKPNVGNAATRQLLDAVTRARQLALSHRTTVYMVFVPPSFWDPAIQPNYNVNWTDADRAAAANLLDKQMVGYNFVVLRSVGDQPGVNYPRYLLERWRTLPQGAYISPQKFLYSSPNNPRQVLTILTNVVVNPVVAHTVYGFNADNIFPFPLEQTAPAATINGTNRWITLPYIAFNGMGQLVNAQGELQAQPEFIPITEGNISYARDPATKAAVAQPLEYREAPSGNTTNNYKLVYVDQLTGRGRIEHMKVQ